MTSDELEQYSLEEVHCDGCDNIITIPVPFIGPPLCSECVEKEFRRN
jgi:hypothetical protein